MTRYILTVTPPTPNGDLHLGHLSGPFLSADVMRRALIAQGHDVIMVCYSDDYQSYLPRKAEALDRDAASYSRLMHRAITLSADLAGVAFDAFPTSRDNPWFIESVNHYLDCVSSDLNTEAVQVHRCPTCAKWGHEAFGRGNCNNCGESSDASQCESCASKPTPALMTDMTCVNCGTAMTLKTQNAKVWHLGRHFKTLSAQHKNRSMRNDLRRYLRENLKRSDDIWPITRPGETGLPIKRFKGDNVHTWFMGLSGYRAAVKSFLQVAPNRGTFADWWSPGTEIVHFLGFDCSYSHAIAYGVQQICDPDGPNLGRFVTNRFLKLDGDDFSTSRGNAVWIKDLTGMYPLDAIRLFTALHAPETQAEDFSMNGFKSWLSEVFIPMQSALSSAPISPKSSDTWLRHKLVKEIRSHTNCDTFSIQETAKAVLDLYRAIRQAPSVDQPAGYRLFADLAAPLMPTTCAQMAESFSDELV